MIAFGIPTSIAIGTFATIGTSLAVGTSLTVGTTLTVTGNTLLFGGGSTLTDNGSGGLTIAGAANQNVTLTSSGTGVTAVGNSLLLSNVSNGLVVGNTGDNSYIFVGQSSQAYGELKWVYNATSSLGVFRVQTTGSTLPIQIDGSTLFLQGNTNQPVVIGSLAVNSEATGGMLQVSGAVAPGASATYDLGTTSFIWRNAYVGTLTLTNDLTVVNGGTGASAFTANAILTGNGTSAIQSTGATMGVAGNLLTFAGASTITDNGSGTTTLSGATGASLTLGSGIAGTGIFQPGSTPASNYTFEIRYASASAQGLLFSRSAADYTGAVLGLTDGVGRGLSFYYNAGSSTTLTEGGRITHLGNVLIGGTTDIPGSGGLKVFGTTASTSVTTGALIVAGGVGVAGALFVGGVVDATISGVRLNSASITSSGGSLIISPGLPNSSGAITVTSAGVTVRCAGGIPQLSFGVTTTDYIFGSTGSIVTLGPGATTGNTYGVLTAYNAGLTAVANLVLQVGPSGALGNVFIGSTTATMAGLGGLYVNGAVNIGGALVVTGLTALNSTTDTTGSGNGAVQNAGGLFNAKTLITAKGQGWGVTSTATATGTTALAATSTTVQVFTGSLNQTVTLPAANTFGAGIALVYVIKSRTSGSLVVTAAGADRIDGMATWGVTAGSSITLVSDGVASWEIC